MTLTLTLALARAPDRTLILLTREPASHRNPNPTLDPQLSKLTSAIGAKLIGGNYEVSCTSAPDIAFVINGQTYTLTVGDEGSGSISPSTLTPTLNPQHSTLTPT